MCLSQVVPSEKVEIFSLFLRHLSCFEIGFEERVRDGVDGHETGGFIRLFRRVGAADDIHAAIDLRILDLVQEVVQFAEVLFRRLSGSESGGEFEVTVVMLLSGDFDDGLHILGFEHGVFRGFELVEFFVQLRERTVAVGLHEGGGQMAHHGGVTAALGNLRLPDVVDDVQIIMWNPARKHVRPVVT